MQLTSLFEGFWVLAFIAAFWHLSKTRSWKHAAVFFVPAFLWGFLIEFFGIYLYNMYSYPNEYLLGVADVPFAIAFAWAAIIYCGYLFVTKKLRLTKRIKLGAVTALICTLFDALLLEPMAFTYKLWVWDANNFWFGAPFLNFVGWFFAILIFVLSYEIITKKFTETRAQFFYMNLVLVVGIATLEAIGLAYFFLFGAT